MHFAIANPNCVIQFLWDRTPVRNSQIVNSKLQINGSVHLLIGLDSSISALKGEKLVGISTPHMIDMETKKHLG